MAAAPPDLITPFLTSEYNDFLNTPHANNLGKLLAVADSIHDFGKGYRNLPSQDGIIEANRFLRNGYVNLLGGSWPLAKNILLNGYTDIEATNRSFFETRAEIPWVSSLPKPTVSVDDIIGSTLLEGIKRVAIEQRTQYIGIEIMPGTTTISSLATPGDDGKLPAENIAKLKKLEVFILTFLFGDPDAPCYFASDADAKQVGKILSQSRVASGMIFPQTIADSATTSLGKSLTQNPDRYYFPHDLGDGNTFTSTANNFTEGIFKITYNNSGFSEDKPFAWNQTITLQAAVGGAGAAAPPSATLQYGPDTGVEGPSVDQLLQLQVKTRTSDSPPSVRISKSSQFDLSSSIVPIYSTVKDGITSTTHSLYMDIKRCGDQDQCLAVSYARRDPKFKGRVALITGDITCAIKNRCYDNPTVEHYNDRIRLYRSSRTERLLSKIEKLQLQYRKLLSEIKQYEPIIKFFLAPGRSTSFIDSIVVGSDEKITDLNEYLVGRLSAGAGAGVGAAGLQSAIDLTDIITTPVTEEVEINISTATESELTSKNTELETKVDTYRKVIDRIIQATSVDGTPLKTLEFLGWYVAHAAMRFDGNQSYPELRYDPSNIKPMMDAGWDKYMDASAPNNIIRIIDNYNKQLIKWCNSFFNQDAANRILNEAEIAFNGDSAVIEQLKLLIERLYSISLKSSIKLYEGLKPADVLSLWKVAVGLLLKSMKEPAVPVAGAAMLNKKDVSTLEATIETTLKSFPIALDYILDRTLPIRSATSSRIPSRSPLTAAAAATSVRISHRQAAAAAATSVRISQRLAAAAAAGEAEAESTIGVGAKRKRGQVGSGKQVGGAACITRVDIVDELYDFFGTVAAIFRTKIYAPAAAAYGSSDGNTNMNAPAAAAAADGSSDGNTNMNASAAAAAADGSSDGNTNMNAPAAAADGVVSNSVVKRRKKNTAGNGATESSNVESAYIPPSLLEKILTDNELQKWAVDNMYVYEQLFNELVRDKFFESAGRPVIPDCSDYFTLIEIISNLFILRDGEEALKFFILVSIIDDLLGTTKSPLIARLVPGITGLSADIKSNRGVATLNDLIITLLKINFKVSGLIRRHLLGARTLRTARLRSTAAATPDLLVGGSGRRTQRRYSRRQYKKRSTAAVRRHRRRSGARYSKDRNQ